MKKTTKLWSVLLTLCLCLGLLPAGALAVVGVEPSDDPDTATITSFEGGTAAEDLTGDTVVLQTMNIRGDVDVYPKVAALKAEYEARGAEVILVDAGNFLSGSVYAAADMGETIVGLMEKVGYRAAAVQAHEFDWGDATTGSANHNDLKQYKTLFDLAEGAKFDFVSSNVTKADKSYAFKQYAIVESKSGVKFGFVAATALESGQTLAPAFSALTFGSAEAQAAAISAAKAADADVVIALSGGTRSEIYGKDGTLIADGEVVLDDYAPDAAIAAEVDAIKLANKDAQFARSEVKLNGADDAARKGETNLGDFWADALRWFAVEGGIEKYYDEDEITAGNTGIIVDDDHVVALWNAGNLSGDVNAGTVTDTELQQVLRWPNKVAVVYMTGAQLREALEAASQGLPYTSANRAACASLMQVSGLKYTVDVSKRYDAGEAYGASWYKANSVNRVTITEVNGKPFGEKATYAVVTNNANFNGMDSSYIFAAAKEADIRSTITTAGVREVAVWSYIKNKLNGVIGSEYAAPQGRIAITGTATAYYADIVPNAWYAEAVHYAMANNLMTGMDGGFYPNGSTTRAMLVTILYRMAGSPAVAAEGGEWYSAARAWAMAQGISDGTRMTDVLTREEAMTMLYRWTQKNGGGFTGAWMFLLDFPDAAELSDWANEAMHWMVMNKVVTGLDGRLAARDPLTRAQMAKILMVYNAL